MSNFDDTDMGDYAEKVLACLDLGQRYYAHRTGENLVSAKKSEMELRKLSLIILETLGRRRAAVGQQSLFDAEPAAEKPAGLPD